MKRSQITTAVEYFAIILFLLGSIFLLQGCKTQKPIPTAPTASTQKDFIKKRLNWMVRNTVEAFKREAKPHLRTDEAAIKFLENACRLNNVTEDAPPYEQQEQDGRAMIEAGNDDPLILLWYGVALYNTRQKKEESVKFIKKALEDLRETHYPKIQTYFAAGVLATIMSALGMIEEEEEDFLKKVCYRSLGESILAGEFETSESPIAFRLGNDSDYVEVYGIIRNQKKVDPWLLLMFEALSEINTAWDKRGGGLGGGVTQKGWKGFHEHLSIARDLLIKAWRLHPEYPESAEHMITIATGSRAGLPFKIDQMVEAIKSGVLYDSEERIWFDRAVAAQMDYRPAYRKLLWGFRPRWGGSYQKMFDFGIECLETKRFDTDVPAFALEVLTDIGGELRGDNWRAPFRRPGVPEKLQDLFKGLLNEPRRAKQRERTLTQQALVEAWSGNYERAPELLQKIDREIDFKTCFPFDLPWSAVNRNLVEAELRAFTGAQSELLKKGESLSIAGDTEEASRLFEQALEGCTADREVYSYLLQRIGMMRMGGEAGDVHIGQHILHVAVNRDRSEVIKFLLDKGAEANPRDDRGSTPLHLACETGKKQIVALLLEYGADANARTKLGRTPLHEAAKSGQPRVVELLLGQKGIDVNAPATNGWTPLHVASFWGFDDIVQQLLDKGANPDLKLSDGRTALRIAQERGMTNVIKVLAPQ